MRGRSTQQSTRRYLAGRLGGERGIVIVVVMMFCLVFLVLGLALYWLSVGQIRSTETERKDVKAFNVAEAGVDAGMLALKLNWPFTAVDTVNVDGYLIKSALQAKNSTLYDSTNSSPSEFLRVVVYDNSEADKPTEVVTEPPAVEKRVFWDANGDGKMFVDATSDVQDDRHRILLLAERQVWNLYFPVGMALYANQVAANGQGYDIQIEDGPSTVFYDVHDVQGKGINAGVGVSPLPTPSTFDQVITESLIHALEGLAVQKGTYFTDDGAAETFLTSGNAGGSVVYVKSASAVEISANTQIGSVDAPVVVIIDTPDGSVNGWDMRGSADFWGILVVLGDTTLRGTCSTHGALFCSGTLDNKGNGSAAELYYNSTVIQNINRQYVLSVNIVANTWEEYTLPEGSSY
jgi:hypothetical protein